LQSCYKDNNILDVTYAYALVRSSWSKTEKLAPAASLVSVHHLRPKAGQVDPVWV